MGIFIPADSDQPVREVIPENGTDFKLAHVYTLLSCDMIEILSIADGRIMVLDEEGTCTRKPRNERATRMANFITPQQMSDYLLHMRECGVEVIRVGEPITEAMTETDSIVGDVLICGDDEVR